MLRCVSSVEEALNVVEGSNGYEQQSLDMIPMKFRTKQVCEKAVKTYYQNFIHVPNELKLVSSIYTIALKQNPLFLAIIDQKDIMEEMVNLVMSYTDLDLIIIRYVPEQFRTYEICLKAVLYDEDLSIYIIDPDIFEKVLNKVNKNKNKPTNL